jgi:hypothetical protein
MSALLVHAIIARPTIRTREAITLPATNPALLDPAAAGSGPNAVVFVRTVYVTADNVDEAPDVVVAGTSVGVGVVIESVDIATIPLVTCETSVEYTAWSLPLTHSKEPPED